MKLFRFKTLAEDEKLEEWLLSFKTQDLSATIRKYLDDIRTRKYVFFDEHDLMKRKLVAEVKIKEATATIKEFEASHLSIFAKTPTNAAFSAKKTQIEINEVPSCYDEKNHRFDCVECGVLFVFAEDEHDIAEAKANFVDHYFQKHGEIPKKLERELMEH